MVTPTGSKPPITIRKYDPAGYLVSFTYRQKAFQKKPFNLVLYYYARYGRFGFTPYEGPGLGSPWEDAETICNWKKYDQSYDISAMNMAYERFKGRTYDTAQLGVDFVEYRQSLDMVEHSVSTLWKFTRSVRKGDFAGAARHLRMKFHPKGVSARRSWSNNWLEYHFGWEPLVRDIYDSLEVLNNPLKNFTSNRGRGFNYKSIVEKSQDPSSSVWSEGQYLCYYLWQQGGQVEAITNRGLHSLDQFGLLNPLTLVWETIPFSFVVDWFANVGNVLGSFSDFAGMTLKNTYYARKYIVSHTGFNYYRPSYTGTRPYTPRSWYAFGVQNDRNVGLSSPQFSVKPLRLPSSTRAVTAVALLNQILH